METILKLLIKTMRNSSTYLPMTWTLRKP